jgi:hypothetical protein
LSPPPHKGKAAAWDKHATAKSSTLAPLQKELAMSYLESAQRATSSDHRQSDAEYFRDRPSARWRMTIRRFRSFAPGYFTFQITTRDGRVCTGDRWDIYGKADHDGGTPLERFQRTVQRLLADPNRTVPA